MTNNINRIKYQDLIWHPSVAEQAGIAPKFRNINFDNAATTPPLKRVMDAIISFAPYYSSVHRGTGARADKASEIYDSARSNVLSFFGASGGYHEAVFTSNTTDAINRLSNILADDSRKKVLVTEMEHHSNDLPWRKNFRVERARTDTYGRLDLNNMEHLLKQYGGRIKLVSVTGASNVTGYVNDIHLIASMAHRHGAEIFVDAAQLAPHISISMVRNSDEDRIDYLAFSAHKMYAPFGAGALIAPKHILSNGRSDAVGGGTVDVVTADTVTWADEPYRYEAGTPNLMGIVAMDAAMRTLAETGMEKIAEHEQRLTEYLFRRLSDVDGLTIYPKYGDTDKNIGVITFNMEGIHHSVLAHKLAAYGGIDVRNGCFCAQPYVQKLLNIAPADVALYAAMPKELRPGMVRVSFGLYNTKAEADILIAYLKSLRR